jgi:hypothetical protein
LIHPLTQGPAPRRSTSYANKASHKGPPRGRSAEGSRHPELPSHPAVGQLDVSPMRCPSAATPNGARKAGEHVSPLSPLTGLTTLSNSRRWSAFSGRQGPRSGSHAPRRRTTARPASTYPPFPPLTGLTTQSNSSRAQQRATAHARLRSFTDATVRAAHVVRSSAHTRTHSRQRRACSGSSTRRIAGRCTGGPHSVRIVLTCHPTRSATSGYRRTSPNTQFDPHCT